MNFNKIANYAIMLFIIYALGQSQIKKYQKDPVAYKKKVASYLPATTPSNAEPKNYVTVKAEDNSSLVNRQIASVLNKVFNTETGTELLKKIVSNQDILPEAVKVPKEFEEMNITDEVVGSGEAVQCGQEVAITYIATSLDGKVIEQYSKATPLILNIGSKQALAGLELGVLGMKAGGKRKIVMSPYLTEGKPKYHNPSMKLDGYAVFNIEIEHMGQLPLNTTKLQIIEKKQGNGILAKCGDKVKIKYRVNKIDGSEIYSSKDNDTETVKIGSHNVPYSINRALEYMSPGAVKIIISPPELLNNIASKPTSFFPGHIKLPQGEMVMFEIEML
jgi:FKBP-type peptidyl-prolyl cis-trans isomerase